MSLGLGVLKLSPAVFWAMTLAELQAAVAGQLRLRDLDGGDAPLSRARFFALMKQFPDGD